jgi:NitT/TauT family transport system substrate-binding protein
MVKQLAGSMRVAALATASFFLSPDPGSAQIPVKMVLDWNFEGQQSPYALAIDAGIFQRNGLAVQIDRGYGSGDAVVKVASGAYQFGIADLGSVIAFDAKQGGYKVISVFQLFDLAPVTVMALTSSGIRGPADLKGRTLGAPQGDSSRVMFPVFARANNLDLATVKWIDLAASLRDAMLVQGKVDAISAQLTEILSFRALNVPEAGLTVLKYSDYGVRLYGHAFITTPEYVASNKDTVTRLLRSMSAAWDAAIADPKASIAAIKKRDPLVNEDVELGRFEIVLHQAIATPEVIAHGFSSVDPARLKQTVDAVTTSYDLPAIDAAELYHPEYLPPRAELAFPPMK